MEPRKWKARVTFAQREKLIFRAASALFPKKGYSGTTTRALARQAGINEALIFRHFPSKRALYQAWMKQKLSAVGAMQIPPLQELGRRPLRAGLRKIGEAFIDAQQRDPSLLRAVLFASLENPRVGRLFLRERLPFREFMESYCAEQIRQGRMRPIKPGVAAQAFLALCFNYVLGRTIFQAPELYPGGRQATLQGIIDIFLRGVSP